MRLLAVLASAIAFSFLAAGCAAPLKSDTQGTVSTRTTSSKPECSTTPAPGYDPTPRVAELDHIYSLTAYAVALRDWQSTGWEDDDARGYNIAGVLVDPSRKVGEQLICWARNAVIETGNGTQHGEVRLITNYLTNSEATKVKDLKLYTTLEPCAMCSGMMTLQSLRTVVYGQTDPGFGAALERLSLNSTKLEEGHCPYPRAVQSVESNSLFHKRLDEAFSAAGGSIVVWLASDEAKSIYTEARDELMHYEAEYPENGPAVLDAKGFLARVPQSYRRIPYTEACPE